MRCLSILLFLLATWVISGNTNTDSGGPGTVFPRSWDTAGVFKDKHVLAWVQFEDTHKLWSYVLMNDTERLWYWPHSSRNCLVMETGRDTSGRAIYTISLYISYPGPTTRIEWKLNLYMLCSYANIFEVYTKSYDQSPDSSEVYDLLKEWDFTFYHKGHPTVVEGIDYRLWMQVLGWRPDRARLINPH